MPQMSVYFVCGVEPRRLAVAWWGLEVDPRQSVAATMGVVYGAWPQVLDGIPESAVLGMSLVGGSSVSVSLLAGIWTSTVAGFALAVWLPSLE